MGGKLLWIRWKLPGDQCLALALAATSAPDGGWSLLSYRKRRLKRTIVSPGLASSSASRMARSASYGFFSRPSICTANSTLATSYALLFLKKATKKVYVTSTID